MATTESEPRAGIEAFPALWQRVVTTPHAFFADMPLTGGLGEPTLFLALSAAINAVGIRTPAPGRAALQAARVVSPDPSFRRWCRLTAEAPAAPPPRDTGRTATPRSTPSSSADS